MPPASSWKGSGTATRASPSIGAGFPSLGRAAIRPLTAAMNDRDDRVAARATQSLGWAIAAARGEGADEAVPLLARLLKSQKTAIRRAAFLLLRDVVNRPRHLPIVLDALASDDEAIRIEAVEWVPTVLYLMRENAHLSPGAGPSTLLQWSGRCGACSGPGATRCGRRQPSPWIKSSRIRPQSPS